jgi:hypothetical protein
MQNPHRRQPAGATGEWRVEGAGIGYGDNGPSAEHIEEPANGLSNCIRDRFLAAPMRLSDASCRHRRQSRAEDRAASDHQGSCRPDKASPVHLQAWSPSKGPRGELRKPGDGTTPRALHAIEYELERPRFRPVGFIVAREQRRNNSAFERSIPLFAAATFWPNLASSGLGLFHFEAIFPGRAVSERRPPLL